MVTCLFKFNINPFTSISNMFGTWLNGIDSPTKACICIGVSALLWAIWNSRNDIVFNKMEGAHFLRVINRATYWIHMWSFLLTCRPTGTYGHWMHSNDGGHFKRLDV